MSDFFLADFTVYQTYNHVFTIHDDYFQNLFINLIHNTNCDLLYIFSKYLGVFPAPGQVPHLYLWVSLNNCCKCEDTPYSKHYQQNSHYGLSLNLRGHQFCRVDNRNWRDFFI